MLAVCVRRLIVIKREEMSFVWCGFHFQSQDVTNCRYNTGLRTARVSLSFGSSWFRSACWKSWILLRSVTDGVCVSVSSYSTLSLIWLEENWTELMMTSLMTLTHLIIEDFYDGSESTLNWLQANSRRNASFPVITVKLLWNYLCCIKRYKVTWLYDIIKTSYIHNIDFQYKWWKVYISSIIEQLCYVNLLKVHNVGQKFGLGLNF